MDKSKPAFWKNVKPGDIVLLSDQQALQDSVEAGLGPKPLEYAVSNLTNVRDFNDFGNWLLIFLEPSQVKQELVLLCKMVDENLDLRLYYQTEFQPGSRNDIIKRGDYFLFQQPADPASFQPQELKFTAELINGPNQWNMKGFGEIHGIATFRPLKSGLGEVIATVAEFELVKGESADTEVLILELGNETESLVTLYAGCSVNPSEIDVFPVKEV